MWHDLGAKGVMDDLQDIEIEAEISYGYLSLLQATYRNADTRRISSILQGSHSIASDLKPKITLNSLQGGKGQEIRYGGCAE